MWKRRTISYIIWQLYLIGPYHNLYRGFSYNVIIIGFVLPYSATVKSIY